MAARWKANLMLVAAAMIWGAAFVAQSVGMEYVEPYTFLGCRSLLGGLVLLPVIVWMDRRDPARQARYKRKDLVLASVVCGVILFASTTLQQFGLLYTTAGKSGFITALYVVLVPLCGLLLKRKVAPTVWLGVALAAVALYLLCINESFTVGRGELLTLGCAGCFMLHIMVIDHFSDRVDGVKLSCTQFFVSGALGCICMFLFEEPSLPAIAQCWLPIGYAGIFSCGVAYTFQILGQQNTHPTVAALLMSTESVFAVLFGALLLRERLLPKEYAGCILMFAAIILAQLPQRVRAKNSMRG